MNESTTSHSTLSRRTVAKGVAWSVPAVAVTIAAPAYASSGVCPLTSSSSSGLYRTENDGKYWVYTDASFGRVWVDGLPEGVTVTSVSTTKYLAHADFRWVNNTDGTGNGGQYLTGDGKTWAAFSGTTGTLRYYDSKGSTAGTPVTNTATYDVWALKNSYGPCGRDTEAHHYVGYTSTWTATEQNNTLRQGVYETDANGCRNFMIPELGEFTMREPNAHALWHEGDLSWRTFQTYEAVLSDGTVLTWATWSSKAYTYYGADGQVDDLSAC
ncbi:hypothetical protein NJC10_09760 [Micrococcus sp. M4NT]|uniref:hypothetical protein n=1 Tax=Micrococcus sp. M4NT TaxID=2957501 RepID=UPI0029A22EF6|nr:hypothetical protein [Micrococcus sp. M4NT]MDX2341937.1 hypothetical protein [Micrococcus sp. M4NT]